MNNLAGMQNSAYLQEAANQLSFATHDFTKKIAAIRSFLLIGYNSQQQNFGLATAEQLPANLMSISKGFSIHGILPPLYPEWLGSRTFCEVHKVRFSYIGGEMARGIASIELVEALAKIGMLAFFGAAGLSFVKVKESIEILQKKLNPLGLSFGSNLIHSPDQLELEEKLVQFYLDTNLNRISASAFTRLTKNIVWYTCKGLHIDKFGQIKRRNYLFAKISHPSVAGQFMHPAPAEMLNELVQSGKLTSEEARLACKIPVAEDITVESDSGGHTDNRPLTALFSSIKKLSDEITEKYNYSTTFRLGAAGSLGTPQAIAAAYALGAAYVLIGSVHQAALESGLSHIGKEMLANTDIGDVIMAPAADMFEAGVKVQVLRKGTMMAVRGNQLYELFKRYQSLEEIPAEIIMQLEKNVFRKSIAEIWHDTIQYFTQVDPTVIEQAEKDPKFKMSLIFRWYLGNSSRWPLAGDNERKVDYQIWCGPAMGAFNRWVKNTFLEQVENRKAAQIALNLLEGAAVITRAHQVRTYGVDVPAEAFDYRPVMMRY